MFLKLPLLHCCSTGHAMQHMLVTASHLNTLGHVLLCFLLLQAANTQWCFNAWH